MLQIKRPKRCNGCGLCVLKSSQIKSQNKNKIGFKNNFIRIIKNYDLVEGEVKKDGEYKVFIDYGQLEGEEEIEKICPRKVFKIDK